MRLLQVPGESGIERDFSEETARLIDGEVRRIVETEHARARELLGERRAALDAIARELLTRETIEHADLESIVRDQSAKQRVARSA
jgi:cell division protease FtsH